LPKLDHLIEEFPSYQYPSYFKAKLLLALDTGENALAAFLPFAKQKRNDFWVWELMSDIFSNQEELRFACLCKALSLRTPEDFIVKLRQQFAKLLIEKKLYKEAKTEILKVIATREKHEWKIPFEITQWSQQEWYTSSQANNDNRTLYSLHSKKAEEILFQDIPEEFVVVEFVNENKSMLNFVKDKKKFGFFNYGGQLNKPQIGDVLRVRFNGPGQDSFYKILTAVKTEFDEPMDAIKLFEGELKLISPQNFGFVGDVFIEPRTIEIVGWTGGETIKGRAMLSFNKKKNEWGWKAIKIDL
jgi:hypothetical protein